MRKLSKLDLATVSHVVLLFLTAILLVLVQKLPLVGTLGFESANLFVTIFGPFFCLAAAFNRKDKLKGYGQILNRELIWLLAHLAFFGIFLFINGFYLKSCSSGGAGLFAFLVIGVPPLLLNVSLGVLLACLVPRTILKTLIWLLAYLAYYTFVILLWWQDSAFRVLTHPSILITSDLLKGDTLTPAVVGFRTATLLLAFAVIWFGINYLSDQRQRMFNQNVRRPFLMISIIMIMLISHVVLHIKSTDAIGKNKAMLKKAYVMLAEKDGLRVFADPNRTPVADAKLILDEARFYKKRIKERLGSISDAPVIIWLHQTNDEKFLYTGAKNVHFALPRHREIHIAGAEVPHEILGHELAHIYVGEYSTTLYGVPGKHWLIPNMALTEGLAVYLTKELNINNGLTLMEQAQAIYQANIRMDLDRLFSNNPIFFAMAHPKASYIYSGATLEFFIDQIQESKRHTAIQELIRVGDFSTLFVNHEDHAMKMAALLKKLSDNLPSYAVLWAQKHFPKSSILASDCSEEAMAEKMQLHQAMLNQDTEKLTTIMQKLPIKNRQVMLDRSIDDMLSSGSFALALSLIDMKEKIKGETSPAALNDFKLKKLDTLVNVGDLKTAYSVLQEINDENFPISTQRLLTTLRILFMDYVENGEQMGLSKTAISYLFAKTKNQSLKLADFAYYFGQETLRSFWKAPQTLLMATYVYARFYMRNERHQEAIALLNYLLKHHALLPPLIEKETKIMLGSSRMALGDFQAALDTFSHILAQTPAEKLYLNDQIQRLIFKLQNK